MAETIEQTYYENDAFWKPEAFDDVDRDRLDFLVSRVPEGIDSLLDVGCGNGLFLSQLKKLRTDIRELHGAERSKAALRYVTTSKTEASIDALPLADRSFECVTSFEVIEHLPSHIYEKALVEITRVSKRYLMISVPKDQDLSIGQIQCSSCKTLFNPDYHFRRFSQESLEFLFSDFGFKIRNIEKFGINKEFLFISLLMKLKRDRSNRFTQAVPCPACGLVLPGRQATSAQHGGSDTVHNRRGIKQTIKSLWPTKKTSRWLLAVYERV